MNSHVKITRTGHVLTATKYDSIRDTTIFIGDYDPTQKHYYFDDTAMFINYAKTEAGHDGVEFINYK